jgi:hypothetical protein
VCLVKGAPIPVQIQNLQDKTLAKGGQRPCALDPQPRTQTPVIIPPERWKLKTQMRVSAFIYRPFTRLVARAE